MQIVDDFYDVDIELEKFQEEEKLAKERAERMAARKLVRQKRELEELKSMGVVP